MSTSHNGEVRTMSPWKEAVLRGITLLSMNSSQPNRWENIIATDQYRVLSVLTMSEDNMRNRWADSPEDLYPLLNELVKTAQPNNAHWRRLVSLRVVDKLVTLVIHFVDFMREVSTIPAKKVLLESLAPPPYCLVLAILAAATNRTRSSSSAADLTVINSLKSRWSELTKKLWEEPEKIYKTWWTKFHSFSILVSAIAEADRSFFRIIHDSSDVTIPILFRLFTHVAVFSQDEENLHLWAHSRAIQITLATAGYAAPPRVVKQILLGLPQQSPARFYSKIASLLSQLPASSQYIDQPIQLFRVVHDLALGNDEWMKAAARSGPLWTEVFRHLNQEAVKFPVQRSSSDAADASNSESVDDSAREEFVKAAVAVLAIMMCLSIHCYDEIPDECEGLIVTWTRANVFGMFDEVLPRVVFQTHVPMTLHFILCFFARFAQDKPSLHPILRTQFPRPRALRAMLGRAYTISISEDGQSHFTPVLTTETMEEFHSRNIQDRGLHVPDDMPTQGMWRAFERIRVACADERECMRRGCKKKGTKRCTECIDEVRYCSAECQKRDWKEHRLICGFLRYEAAEQLRSSSTESLAEPIEFPWRFEAAQAV